MKKCFHITVRGKVQGVYFRASAKQTAYLLVVCGTVRNLPSGEVYIEAEGDEEALVRLVQWCHHGPERADVQNVSVHEGPITDAATFEVVR